MMYIKTLSYIRDIRVRQVRAEPTLQLRGEAA
jgi:hypothetical protein